MLLNEQNKTNEPTVLKVKDVQNILSLSKTRAYDLMKEPPFPVLRLGNTIRIPAKSFYEWFYKATGNEVMN